MSGDLGTCAAATLSGAGARREADELRSNSSAVQSVAAAGCGGRCFGWRTGRDVAGSKRSHFRLAGYMRTVPLRAFALRSQPRWRCLAL